MNWRSVSLSCLVAKAIASFSSVRCPNTSGPELPSVAEELSSTIAVMSIFTKGVRVAAVEPIGMRLGIPSFNDTKRFWTSLRIILFIATGRSPNRVLDLARISVIWVLVSVAFTSNT